MLERVKARFDLHPERLIADTAYGTAPMLGWLVGRKIAPHIPVFDKSGRNDGTWTRADFERDAAKDQYICPEGHELKQFRRNYSDPNRGAAGKGTARYRALKELCQACPSKAKCCPNADARKITREEHEDARQVARDIHWSFLCAPQQTGFGERSFQKTILQRQLANLCMQRFGIDIRLLGSLRRVVKDIRHAIQKLILPLLDLVRMHVKMRRQLAHRLVALQCCRSDFRLKGRAVVSPWLSSHFHSFVPATLPDQERKIHLTRLFRLFRLPLVLRNRWRRRVLKSLGFGWICCG